MADKSQSFKKFNENLDLTSPNFSQWCVKWSDKIFVTKIFYGLKKNVYWDKWKQCTDTVTLTGN